MRSLAHSILEVVERHLQRLGAAAIGSHSATDDKAAHDPLGQSHMVHVARHALGRPAARGWEPMYDNAITWRWRATRQTAGLTGVRLHDLRHFFASGLIAEGCDVVTVQRALGHASATTTLNTSSHLWPTAADRTRGAAGNLMRTAIALRAQSVHSSGLSGR